MFDTLINDVRYALRTLLARPGFSVAVVLTLALGIGANALVFSLIDGLFLKALPYRDDASLIDLSNRYALSGPQRAGVSIPDYIDRRDGVPALSGIALYTGASLNLSTEAGPQRLQALRATPSLFPTLGVDAALGRTFSEDEATIGNDKVIVLGNALWRNGFNADLDIVGRDLRIDGEKWRVVGVMPEDFMFPNRDFQLFVPFAFTEEQRGDRQRGHEFSGSVARLAPGADLAQVQAQCDAIIRRNAERIGAMGADGAGFRSFIESSGFTVSAQPLRSILAGEQAGTLLLLQGAVGLVLLIVCANIANLLLTRFSSRRKEISVRAALGAGRRRIARQLFLETAVLALLGGATGLVIAMGGARLVADSGLVPNWVEVGLNWRTIGFGFGLSMIAALMFGVLPIFSAVGSTSRLALREGGRFGGGGRAANRTRKVLVVVQLALAVTLLAGSGLMLRSFAKVLGEAPGFDSGGLLTAALTLPASRYAEGPAQIRGFEHILESVRRLPGIESVALSTQLPFDGRDGGASYRIAGRDDAGAPPHGHVLNVDPDYFNALRIPLLRGRAFSRADWDNAAKVVIIDEAFERKQFPAGDAIGSQLDMGRPSAPDLYTIIGVVGNAKYADLSAENREETYYFNFAETPTDSAMLTLRSTIPPAALVEPLRNAIHAVDVDLPLFDVKTMQERIDLSLSGRRVPMQLLGVFALIAMVLAGIGIYGVLAFAVTQRTGEFGVRMAIGADASRIRQHVISDGAILIGSGLGLGLIGAIALGLVLRSQLFGVGSIDPPSLALVVLLLGAIAFIACWLPARRAAATDPIDALRNE
ncbi:ABC transporter permease [Dokdonella immobilis]|uniref:Duplicated orphan permease n=1 Tax=Dokdonella immobilis TaxID=578942 RepID=A0A1I4ZNN0_9GAMM|nr:ABC transporter permease [Dokdonella immobilis]SFN51822.1 duplicated orphan permease [Dokdonella immobilis]